LKNKTFIYSSGQNSDNILFNLDEMKSYWINLDLREADISEVGLYSRVDPDNFFNDFLRKSYIIKFTNMPWDEGLRKYFLALASLIRSYENAFKNNLSPDLYKNIFEKPNRLMKEKLEQIIALAARRHAQWISENSLIKEEEETRRKIHDLLIEENLLIF
jgi:hypothetical protein